MEFMQDYYPSFSTPRKGAADSNAPRIPPSQHWWLGGLGGMRDWKAWRGTGIGEAGRGRTQQISSKHWSKAIENLLIFYQNFDAFGSKLLKNLSWKASGGSEVTENATKTRRCIKN